MELAPAVELGRASLVAARTSAVSASGVRTAMDEGVMFQLYVIPNKWRKVAQLATLKCVCGPADDGSPCLTIMLPDQD